MVALVRGKLRNIAEGGRRIFFRRMFGMVFLKLINLCFFIDLYEKCIYIIDIPTEHYAYFLSCMCIYVYIYVM